MREAEASNILPWDEWWKKILQLAELLRDSFQNGRLVPTAVFGISNGGLMVADILGREVYRGLPILSLWANRWGKDDDNVDRACYYFDNAFNKSVITNIKQRCGDNKDITILLVDDLVYTANTIRQAEIFIKRELGEQCKILFTPLFCRETDYFDKIEHMLPYGYNNGRTLNIKKDEFISRVHTHKDRFPYKKAIGSTS